MKPIIIGIAGGTSSGKTTIAKKVYEETKKYGTVAMIKIDDYYVSEGSIVTSLDDGVVSYVNGKDDNYRHDREHNEGKLHIDATEHYEGADEHQRADQKVLGAVVRKLGNVEEVV